MNNKEKKRVEGTHDNKHVRFLGDVLSFNVTLDGQINSKANFLMGASALIFTFTVSQITKQAVSSFLSLHQIAWIIISIGSFLSFLTSILIVTPKIRIFSKKERVKEDVFYYKNVVKFYEREEYIDYLHSLKDNPKLITTAFGNQIYSLSKHILPFKSRMLKRSGWILLLSLVSGGIFIILNSFV